MANTENFKGRLVLLLAHIAGMIDMVALPVWVGAALIGQYQFSPQQAGGMVTLYLLGAVVASVFFASRFIRFSARLFSSIGYGMACLAFLGLTQTRDFAAMAVLHAVAGLAAGAALSFTHGTIGRSPNPHRLFAIVGLGLCVSAIFFLGGSQEVIPKTGGTGLFVMFAAVMALATVACGHIGRFPVRQDVTRLGHTRWFEEVFVEESFIGLFGDLFQDDAQQAKTHIGVFISLAGHEQQGLIHSHLDKLLTRDAGIIVANRPWETSAVGEQMVQGDALFVGRNIGEILADGVFNFEFAHHFQFEDGGSSELFSDGANAGNGLRCEGGFGLAIAQAVPLFEHLPFPGHEYTAAEVVLLVQFA